MINLYRTHCPICNNLITTKQTISKIFLCPGHYSCTVFNSERFSIGEWTVTNGIGESTINSFKVIKNDYMIYLDSKTSNLNHVFGLTSNIYEELDLILLLD